MLEYAASRRQIASRPSSPNAMLAIISVHVALLAVVMSAKMDLPARIYKPPIKVIDFPVPPDPPPQPRPSQHEIAHPMPMPAPQPLPPLPLPPNDGLTATPGPAGTSPIAGGGASIVSGATNPIRLLPVRHDPRLLTPFSELRPPYPASKLASEEEAVLTLRLTIDESGRVVAVDSLGRADRVFVEAARRYMMAHWRYAPATEDGRAVSSSLTVTLKFMLDG